MVKIQKKYIDAVRNASTLSDLFIHLQNAIKLEHATIPAYLSGLMSIRPGANAAVAEIIHSVVIEEMLHMSIACNILNALGGAPDINVPGFIPGYPGPLPMGIDSDLKVGLEAVSLAVVNKTYMGIEEPEHPLEFPVKSLRATEELSFATIGLFYQFIKEQIDRLAPHRLPGDPAKQMAEYFPADQLFPIIYKQDAIKAIDIIVEQGEGTTTAPLDQQHELAHYYRFAEIYYGKRLVADPSEPLGYSYSGDAVVLDPAGVYPLWPNTKLADLPAGSEAWQAASEFNQAYSRLLNALHVTFNGKPDNISDTLGMMYDVKLCGSKLTALPFPGKSGYNVGPGFEYTPLLP